MSYFFRVFSTEPAPVSFDILQEALKEDAVEAALSLDFGEPDAWVQLVLAHPDGTEIAVIQHNVVGPDSPASDELDVFAGEVEAGEPASAVTWLLDYLRRVQSLYVFQVLDGTDHLEGWEILETVKEYIHQATPSITQADNEGFSNEQGAHILWQFDDSISGECLMGVLENGEWRHFEMDLGNPTHKEAFKAGKIPSGVIPGETP